MKSNEIVRELMEKNGIKFNQFAAKVGVKSNALANRLNRENFSTDVLNGMLEVLGYKIVLMPAEEQMKDGWYEVEDSRTVEQ